MEAGLSLAVAGTGTGSCGGSFWLRPSGGSLLKPANERCMFLRL